MKVRIEVVPWLSDAFGARAQGRLVIEQELDGEASLHDLVRSLVAGYRGFGRVAFDPETGNFTGHISVVLNDRLLESPREWATPLKDGDTVILLPAFVGG